MLAILPVVGLIAWSAQRHVGEDRVSRSEDRSWSLLAPRSSIVKLCVWGLIAAATIIAVWPALWVDPLRAYRLLRLRLASSPNDPRIDGADAFLLTTLHLDPTP